MLTPYDIPPFHAGRGLSKPRALMGFGGLVLTVLACLTMSVDSLLVMLVVIYLAGLAALLQTLVPHTEA